jgi:hypothetical protein
MLHPPIPFGEVSPSAGPEAGPGAGSGAAEGDGGELHAIHLRLQQAFLAQYSTEEAPVKMREVAG